MIDVVRVRRRLQCAAAVLFGFSVAAQGASNAPRHIQAFAQKWCADCHVPPEPEADLDLVGLLGRPLRSGDVETVREIRDLLAAGEMPPDDEPRPPAGAVAAVMAWADSVVRRLGHGGPGRVTARRLSRTEYDNTVRDLFGVATALSQRFPADDLGYGFDNIGDALSFSTLHLENYAAAAADIAQQTVSTEDPDHPVVLRFEAESMACSLGERASRGDVAVLTSHGNVAEPVELPRDGAYLIRVSACGDQAGGEPARMAVQCDSRQLVRVDVPGHRGEFATYERRVRLKKGARRISAAFTNDYYSPDHPDPEQRDRNLIIDWVEVVGPVDPPVPTRGHLWLFAADSGAGEAADRARAPVAEMIRRTWRRPAREREIDRLSGLVASTVADGGSFAEGMQQALEAALLSPHFLFRLEPAAAATGAVEELSGFAVASRLSYFLWSSSPDLTLLDLAESGELQRSESLAAQARRMLGDPRATALSENFAAQWLELLRLDEIEPDPGRFPEFSDELRADMRRETELLFESVMREKRGVRELLDADYTFVNERLAGHYGIAGVVGPHFRRIRLLDPNRRGVLGHASFHTVTSNPTRTSPVKRGKWILENLLNDPPPAPPPGNDSFDREETKGLASMREMLAVHRADPKCAVCHTRMDTFGLAVETFDAIGRWRTEEDGVAIDARAELPDGRVIDGIRGLAAALRGSEQFVCALAAKLFVYGVGRDVGPSDELALRDLVAALPSQPTVEDLVVGIVQLDAFRKREIARPK